MLLFAHTGITVGAVWLAGKARPLIGSSKTSPVEGVEEDKTHPPEGDSSNLSRLKSGFSIDYRMLLVGSMLPDLIDKPLGIYILSEQISNGRIFGHTLLFALLILGLGLFFYHTKRYTGILVLALGVFFHLALDQMWNTPKTLFWPLLGVTFDRIPAETWMDNIIQNLLNNPGVFIPEIIGVLLLGLFFGTIIRKGLVKQFIKTGRAG